MNQEEKKPAVRKRRKKDMSGPGVHGVKANISPNDNVKYIMQSLQIANLPNIDLGDPEAVQQRINEYFKIVAENGNKPTVAGLGNALNGMDRQRLWEIRTGNYRHGRPLCGVPSESADLIKKAYKIMEELWENYMQNGKINPVSGIFLGKNNYGYQDKTDVVITPNVPEAEYNAEDIARRYVLPEKTAGELETTFEGDE